MHHMSNAYGTCEYRTYRAWQMMKQRCTNPRTRGYAVYGGRGIQYCSRWESFLGFLEDVGIVPSMLHTLDRIQAEGNYEPGNVRWATWAQQAGNRRNNKMITVAGETKTWAAWARHCEVSRQSFGDRVKRHGEQGAVLFGKKDQYGYRRSIE